MVRSSWLVFQIINYAESGNQFRRSDGVHRGVGYRRGFPGGLPTSRIRYAPVVRAIGAAGPAWLGAAATTGAADAFRSPARLLPTRPGDPLGGPEYGTPDTRKPRERCAQRGNHDNGATPVRECAVPADTRHAYALSRAPPAGTSGQTRLPCFGLTGWEVVLRFARPAPRVPSWSTSNPNSTLRSSGIPMWTQGASRAEGGPRIPFGPDPPS